MENDEVKQEEEKTPIEEPKQEVVETPEPQDLEELKERRKFDITRAVLLGIFALAALGNLLIGSSIGCAIKESLRNAAQSGGQAAEASSQSAAATIATAFALGIVEAMGLAFVYGLLFVAAFCSALGIIFSILRLTHLPKGTDWRRIVHSIILAAFIAIFAASVLVFCYIQFVN